MLINVFFKYSIADTGVSVVEYRLMTVGVGFRLKFYVVGAQLCLLEVFKDPYSSDLKTIL
jgi:hypothetical protein